MMTADQRIHRDRCMLAMRRFKADEQEGDLEIIMDSLVALDIMEVEITVDDSEDRPRARKLYSVKPDKRSLCEALFNKGAS